MKRDASAYRYLGEGISSLNEVMRWALNKEAMIQIDKIVAQH